MKKFSFKGLNIARLLRLCFKNAHKPRAAGTKEREVGTVESEIAAKVIFVGDCCGKSALIWTHVLGHKSLRGFLSTITMFQEYSHSVVLPGCTVHLTIMDTPGQNDFDLMRRMGYRGNDIIVMMFQIGNPDSLDNLKDVYLEEAKWQCEKTPRLLVGCQWDNRHRGRIIEELRRNAQAPVSLDEGIEAAKELDAWGYVECSAKSYVGVKEVFDAIGRMVVAIRQQPRMEQPMPFFVISPGLSTIPNEKTADGLAPTLINANPPRVVGDPPRVESEIKAESNSDEDDYVFVTKPNNIAQHEVDVDSAAGPMPNNMAIQDDHESDSEESDDEKSEINDLDTNETTECSVSATPNNLISQEFDLPPRPNNLVKQYASFPARPDFKDN